MSEKDCFIIAPIGEVESNTRKRSDQILKHVIVPALKECGYKAIRADTISEPGIITSQVIQHIVDDPLVIADLTERNPNVFYELAIRHAIRKPFVQLIKKGEQIPFDVAGTRTIQVDNHDLDSVEFAKMEIISQVKAIEKNQALVETPISVSLDLQFLRQSDNPEQRSLADVLSMITELRGSMLNMEKQLEKKEIIIPREILKSLINIKMENQLERKYYNIDFISNTKNTNKYNNDYINSELEGRLYHYEKLAHKIKYTLEKLLLVTEEYDSHKSDNEDMQQYKNIIMNNIAELSIIVDNMISINRA